MKSLLIIVLFVALLAAAVFTRPTQDDFQRFIVQEQTKGETNLIKKAIDEELAKSTARNATFTNRFFWTDVQQDGKTVYTGAFSHWFNRAQVKSDLKKVEKKSQDGLDQLERKLPKA